MGASLRAWGCAVGVLVGAWGAAAEKGWAQGADVGAFARGQALFERVWQPERDATVRRDGLGPLFNERSCIACHFLGGIGGAGPNEKNVELLTAAIPESPGKLASLQGRLKKLHRGFAAGTSIVLHRFATDPRYAEFRDELLGLRPQAARELIPMHIPVRAVARGRGKNPVKIFNANGAKLLLSQRNTTSLFGSGLIESISQTAIRDVAALQSKENPRVTGRFVGRFGWRGQVNDLGQFIRGACAVELGLQVSTHAQAVDPLPGAAQPISRETIDLTDVDCEDLTAFVAGLPAPRRIEPTDLQQAVAIQNGELLFHALGCAVCHRPTLDSVHGIYSDLLVHDMGQSFSDEAAPPPGIDPPPILIRPSGYGGPTFFVKPLGPDTRPEWKTPPLWGLRDSAPYLHDGRAATIEQAIAAHAGEAADAAQRYLSLACESRAQLMAFLSTLAAPDPSLLPVPLTKPDPALAAAP
jgi:mono/diheme cytochrome c family protein